MLDATEYFGNTIQAWLIAAAVAVGTFFLLTIVRRIAARKLARLAETTDNIVDDLVVAMLRKTRFYFFAAMALWAGARAVLLPERVDQVFQYAVIILVVLQAAVWGNVVINFLLEREIRKRAETDAAGVTTLRVLGIAVRIVFFFLILLIGLDNLGVDITGLITGLGIGGIAVALALQNILGDLFASLSIALDKPFVIGDFIVVGDLRGTVEHIGLKTTRIRSLSGEQIVFSNADLLNSRVRNFKRMDERRAVFTVGVTYQTPHEKLAAIPAMLKEILESRDLVRFDRAHFKEYADSSLTFEVVYFVKSPEYNRYMDIQQAVNLAIYRRFADEGIEFAYPTRTLHVQNAGGAPGGAGKAGPGKAGG